jgi:hypothetical protein
MLQHLIMKLKTDPEPMRSLQKKLSERRQFLLVKIQVERGLIEVHSRRIRDSLSIVDRSLEIMAKLKSHPMTYLGLLTAVFFIKPRRLFSALKTGVFAWQIFERIAPALNAKIGSQPESNLH